MRSSSIALGVVGVLALSACSISTTGNSITFKTQPEFVDSGQPSKTSTADWDGEEITINNDGVNPLTGSGGVEVIVDPAATKVSVSATFAARADTEAEAKLSIADAIGTMAIAEGGGKFAVRCAHGGAHGTSGVAASGCKLLRVTIPSGTDVKPMRLVVGSGNGGIRFTGAVTASSLTVDENGQGDVDVKVVPVKDAVVVVNGGNAVRVSLPSDFSTQKVTLTVNTEDEQEIKARLITTDFPGLENLKSFPTSGAGQNAAREINVKSDGLLDDYTVTLSRL